MNEDIDPNSPPALPGAPDTPEPPAAREVVQTDVGPTGVAAAVGPPAPGAAAPPPPAGDLARAPGRCGAKTRSGQPCKNAGMPNGRCRMHGGRSLGGPASPSFRHGRYSKSFAAAVPERLRARFEAAYADPELLSIRASVALLDVRVSELLDQLGDSDAGTFRERLLELWGDFKRINADKEADKEKRAAKISAVFGQIDELVAKGAAEKDAWSDLSAAIKERASLAAQEHSRLIDLRQVLTVEQAAALVIALHDAVKKHIKDRVLLSQIGQSLDQVVGMRARIVDAAAADGPSD